MNLKKNLYPPYTILLILYLIFIIFAFIIDTPKEIILGLKKIVLVPDILITDYMAVGGIGATLINASLTSTFSILLLMKVGIKPNGSTIMALWLMTGFSFLGKNIFNIWPLILGVYLYSKFKKEQFLNYILVALLGTSLSPVVSQISFSGKFPLFFSILLGVLMGIFIGFILPPVASHAIKSHNGYNLYNIGFACGLLATLIMSVFRGFGINYDNRLLWYTGSNHVFIIFLLLISLYLILIGLFYGKNNKQNIKKITNQSGRLISDFYILFGPTTYINMGILCLFSTFYVLLLKSDLNGATMCGIFTIVGFGSFGKNIRNIVPVMMGATIAAMLHVEPTNSPSLILAILFSTCLAPLCGKFGILIGLLAGFIHVNMVSNIGYIHGGLNLYNNGLAGGFVAMILLPLITTFKKE